MEIAIATAMGVVGNEEGDSKGSEDDGNGNEEGNSNQW
jgi:hypothetical protein